MEQLVTLEEFKNAVELWNSKGFNTVVETRFEDGNMILIVVDYVDPDRSYCVSVPFNDDTFFCLDTDHYSFKS
jgi:hypothetical protein